MSTFGPSYDERVDGARVRRQMEDIRDYMVYLSNYSEPFAWRTLAEISKALDYPEASVSAQLRHLRKERFGAYQVDKRRRTSGTWEYRVLPPPPPGQIGLFESNACIRALSPAGIRQETDHRRDFSSTKVDRIPQRVKRAS